MALACPSAPAMGVVLVVDVEWTSCSVGADAPTTTILPWNTLGLTRPARTSEKETVRMEPGGPGKSISADPFWNRFGLTLCAATAAAALAKPGRPNIVLG